MPPRSPNPSYAPGLPRLSGTLEAAVGQELVNENLGTPQIGTRVRMLWHRVRYGSKERNDYRIAGYFRGVPIIVIFVTHRQVTKFSTHEIFNP